MIVVSFYCDIDGSTYYSDCAKRLIEQCKSFGLDYEIVERNYGKEWIDNVRAKPLFILEMIYKHNDNVLFIDCDCEIINPKFEINGQWGVMLRNDNTPHDFVHYIEKTITIEFDLLEWHYRIEELSSGSHSAFIEIYKELDYFIIPEGHFKLGLAETESKTKYLTK